MATQLTADIQIVEGDLRSNTSTAQTSVGARAVSPEGRVFRYAKAGAVALVPGTLLQAPVEVTNHQDIVPAAAAIGDTSITVTLGATAATVNQYAGGWVMVSITPGQGYQYLIKSHPAANASATLVITLEDPILVALTTASNLDLVANPYNGVVINPTTATSSPIGAAVYPITSAYYGWIQVHGPCNILNDAGSTVGTNVSASNATAGAVEAAVTSQAIIGYAMTGIATTDYGAIFLRIE